MYVLRLKATKATRNNAQNETLADAPSSHQWHRYAMDNTRKAYWWCNPLHYDLCFREDSPGAWRKYLDPGSGKEYWYLSEEHMFWNDTGNTDLISNVR